MNNVPTMEYPAQNLDVVAKSELEHMVVQCQIVRAVKGKGW
jgi:hypothetical protein